MNMHDNNATRQAVTPDYRTVTIPPFSENLPGKESETKCSGLLAF